MSDVKMSKDYGIHTIELYLANLKYTEVQKVIDRLVENGQIYLTQRESYNIDRFGKSCYFIDDGIRLRIHQSYNKSNGIAFIINPSTLITGEYQPVKLWIPTKEAVDRMLEYIAAYLEELGLNPNYVSNLSLSQMDITENRWCGKGYDVTRNIHIFKKSFIPRNFKTVVSKDGDVNAHLFTIKSNRITIKVYDKIYELKQNDRCPKSLEDESILRFEISLKREAFLKKLDLKRTDSLYEMLHTGYENGRDILDDYYDKLFPFSGKSVRYEAAKKLILEKVSDRILREQMLYLLKKTSDSAGLSTATRKLKEHYTDVDHRWIKKILSEFDKLGIAPVTLPKK